MREPPGGGEGEGQGNSAPRSAALAVALFASGGGSNVRALLASPEAGTAWSPALLVTDRPQAPVISLAREAGIEVAVIPPGEGFEDAVAEALRRAGIGMIVLAGYLRLIPPGIVRHFEGRILNVHPSLLPAFGGKGMYGPRIHAAVLARGVQVTGVTVHLVNERFDEGPVLAQWPVPVLRDDTPSSLAARVLAVEHRLYPLVVAHVARALATGQAPRALSGTDLSSQDFRFP